MGPTILMAIELVVVIAGVAGTVLEVVSLVKRRGSRPAWAAIVTRLAGVAALVVLVVAGRGRPDFQDLVFVLYGIVAGLALWAAAAIIDVVLFVKHWRRRD